MLAHFRENLIYKLLALGFAIALHFYVASQENPSQTHNVLVPLAVRGLPPGLLFDEKTVPQIAVLLSGPTDLLNHLPDSEVSAVVDLSKAHAGKNAPKAVHVTLPPNDLAVSAEAQPSAVAITLAAKAKRSILIAASDPGPPPAGFRFRPAHITPPYALLEGSEDSVSAVQQVVANVDSGGSVGTIDSSFAVVALDGQGAQVSGITVTPASVRVRLEMRKELAAKTFLVSPNFTGAVSYPYKVVGIDFSPQTVTVAGRPELLSRASTVQTTPIDLSGVTSDVTRRVTCTPPAGLAVVGPSEVTVTIHVTSPPAPPVSPAPTSPPGVANPDGARPQ